MALDIELYRRTVYVPARRGTQDLRRISVIEIHPEGATQTLVFVHGFGGNVSQWLYQLRFFGQSMHLIVRYLRGLGSCDDPAVLAYTIERFVHDLVVLLDGLQVLEP